MSSGAFENVKTVLVALSSKAQAYDTSALRNFITHAYPDSAVFFITTSGDALGAEAPTKVDLAIDFTPPGARQGFFFSYSLRSCARYAVGRDAGWFYRRHNFDRVFHESQTTSGKPQDYLEQEAWAQKHVLELAGVPVIRQGGVGQNLEKEIALELPPMHQAAQSARIRP